MDGGARKQGILLIFIVVTMIHLFVPLSLAGVSYWDVDSSWRFFSGDPSSYGPIYFSNDFTFSNRTITDDLVRFTDFNMGTLWADIGFSCDTSTANITVTGIDSSEVRYTVNAPSSTVSTTKIYVGAKGSPAEVLNVRNWNYTSGTGIVTAQVLHSSPANVVLRWTGSSGGTGGSGVLPPGTTTTGETITPTGPTGIFSWFYENPSITIALGLLAFFSWNVTRQPSGDKRKKEAMRGLMPDIDSLKDTAEEWREKMKRSVWS